MKNNIPRIMIASAMSGGGKTTAVCALMRALKIEGHKISPFKCGPDYIDPMFHRIACGNQGVNLDLFFMMSDELKTVFSENSKDSDIAVIEGVMGYYDGMRMDSVAASSYDIAKTLDCPVVLVIPAKGMAYTTVPIIKGMTEQFGDSKIKAVILNNVSEMTYKMLKPIIEEETGIKAAGFIPKLDRTIESRHLGLIMPDSKTRELIDHMAKVIGSTVDIKLIKELAGAADELEYEPYDIKPIVRTKIGIANDEAFCFYYKDNMDILKSLGAEIVFFSPLGDTKIPEGINGVIFGGGYPELYARELSENRSMLMDVKSKIENGMPCLAECGGFMYLHSTMEDDKGISYKMADVIKGDAFKTDSLVRFGYVDISGAEEYMGEKSIKGHEFHYWDSTSNGRECIAVKPGGKRSWECMHATESMLAGFAHLYYRSNMEFIKRLILKCKGYEGKC